MQVPALRPGREEAGEPAVEIMLAQQLVAMDIGLAEARIGHIIAHGTPSKAAATRRRSP